MCARQVDTLWSDRARFVNSLMLPRFLGPLHWSAAINLVMRWELKARLVGLGLLRRYARFLVTRADHFYACPLRFASLAERRVWIPRGEDSAGAGLCDRMILCDRRDVVACLSIVDRYLERPREYFVRGRAAEMPEDFHLRRIRELGLYSRVSRFERVMFTVAAEGDATRWTTPANAVEFLDDEAGSRPSLRVKYRHEYASAKWACGLCELGMPYCCLAEGYVAARALRSIFGGELSTLGDRGECHPNGWWLWRPLAAACVVALAASARLPNGRDASLVRRAAGRV